FRHLDSADPAVAEDAFLELAKAGDEELGKAAKRMEPERLRKLLASPQTPPERVGLLAFMLGACGGDRDAEVLLGRIRAPLPPPRSDLSGLLAGYVELRPREGWDLVNAILADTKRPFGERYAVISTVRFFHGYRPDDSRREVVRAMAEILKHGELSDVAIDDLRRWKVWELTDAVLEKYGKEGYDAHIVRRGILRYALSCPLESAKRFVPDRRGDEPGEVADVEESLRFELDPKPAAGGR